MPKSWPKRPGVLPSPQPIADSIPKRRKETPINHNANVKAPAICNCGAVLCRPISIREGRCQACRNEDTRKVPGYGR